MFSAFHPSPCLSKTGRKRFPSPRRRETKGKESRNLGCPARKETFMSDIRGVGKKITYSDDNPVSNWIEALREQRNAHKREPKNDAERKLLARWLGYRGRGELERIVGAGCYAYSHFEMDPEWRYLLADHIRTEAGHGWGYIQQANAA